ncbi:hypothetical protein ABH926_006031 [Catenulispora sp. GP43]|uniref:hypothetical protein n=1 Tax=Catenulispora sp. GP43 TaxID=3156263 RepID=UPI003511F122
MDNGSDVLAEINAALRAFWRGREAGLVTPGLGVSAAGTAAEIESYGGAVTVAVSGVDPAHGAPRVPHLWIGLEHGLGLGKDVFHQWLRDPGAEFGQWLDRADPGRRLLVFCPSDAGVSELCGRPAHGWRRPEWLPWEDKVRVETLWSAVGVPSPPHVLGPVDDPAVRGALGALDGGLGVVVAGDSSQGVLGGGRGLSWVRTAEALDAALDGLRGTVEQVRVARFLPGIPCSVIGIVFSAGTAVFDPFEIVTLCDLDKGQLVLCGSSTRWRPDPKAAEFIRECARRTGERLAADVGFRGMFSIDGVLNEDGFFATEVNPRFSGGLGLDRAVPGQTETLIHRAVVEMLPGVYDADHERVETAVRTAIRRAPSHKLSGRLYLRSVRISAAAARRGLGSRVPDLQAEFARKPDILPDGVIAPFIAQCARTLGLDALVTCADAAQRIEAGW